MQVLFLISLWLHVLAAAAWVGGALFLTLVLVPVLRRPEWRERGLPLIGHAARRFLRVVWSAFALLLVTGLINLYVRTGGRLELLGSGEFWSGSYGTVLGWKLAFVAVILGLSISHDFVLGPRATRAAGTAPGLRVAVRWVGRITLLLGLVVVGLGIALARGGLP